MFDWINFIGVREDRRAEFIHEAENDRLLGEIWAARRPFYSRVLAALGRRLSGWGYWLQARSGEVSELPLSLATGERNPCEQG